VLKIKDPQGEPMQTTLLSRTALALTLAACALFGGGYGQKLPDGSVAAGGSTYHALPEGSYMKSDGTNFSKTADGSFAGGDGSYHTKLPDGSYFGSDGGYAAKLPDGSFFRSGK
jgi:hypothetical protein